MLSHLQETDIEVPYQRNNDGYWYYARTFEGCRINYIVGAENIILRLKI
jgi:hypothetical protein